MVVQTGEALHLRRQSPGKSSRMNWTLGRVVDLDLSYDYGAAFKENRLLTREKYSELKLLA